MCVRGRKPQRGVQTMKRFFGFGILMLMCAAPVLRAQDLNHAEVGVFADYFRLSDTSPRENFIGLGARAAFNVHSSVQLEAEMAYDFKRTSTQTFANGVS